MPKTRPSDLILNAVFGRWPRARPTAAGYTVLLPMPADMPFLLRFALEGLAAVDLANCGQIVVVPDGWDDSGAAALRAAVAASGDPRVELAPLSPLLRFVVRRVRRTRPGIEFVTWAHWAAIVEGTSRARHDHVFLHDADAFFADDTGPERQYAECARRGMATLGVQARADDYFADLGYAIPGTWELVYSTAWARSRPPLTLKGKVRATPEGDRTFDTMLYPQYLDYPGGRVGVMSDPTRVIHFHGTIATFRAFRDAKAAGRPAVDRICRLLLLSILEDLLPPADGRRATPPVDDLARGLTDPTAPVVYDSDDAAARYPQFRDQLEELCGSPLFRGDRADRVRRLVRPFDEFFRDRVRNADAPPVGVLPHGLG